MRGFARTLTSACLAVAILCSLDMHLPLLQVVAWSGMIAKYAHGGSFATALRETFDGDHPCRLCCAIKAARSAPRTMISTAPLLRNDVTLPESQPPVLKSASAHVTLPTNSTSTEPDLFPPPVPPPRAICA